MSLSNIEVPNLSNLYCNSMDFGDTGTPFTKYVSISW